MKAYQTVNYASPKEYRQALADFKKDCLEPVRLGWFALDDKILSPVVQLDASTRPDLGDLARIHRSEGAFDTTTTWDFCIKPGSTGLARLTVEIKRPVKTSFRVIFHLAKHSQYLADIVKNFTLISIKTNASNLEDSISYTIDPKTLNQGLVFYLAGTLAVDLKGGK